MRCATSIQDWVPGVEGVVEVWWILQGLFGVVNGSEAAVKVYNRTSTAKEEMRLELKAYECLGGSRLLFFYRVSLVD